MKYFTDRIELRPLDTDLLYHPPYTNWMEDPEVNKYNSHGIFPKTSKDRSDFINSIENRERIVWTVYICKNTYLGNVSLQSFDWINRSAELAILLGDKDYWGKGVATEACKLVLYHGFRKLNLNRIWLGTLETNIGMIKTARKIGMKVEGVSRKAVFNLGKYRDLHHFSILLEEYKENGND